MCVVLLGRQNPNIFFFFVSLTHSLSPLCFTVDFHTVSDGSNEFTLLFLASFDRFPARINNCNDRQMSVSVCARDSFAAREGGGNIKRTFVSTIRSV